MWFKDKNKQGNDIGEEYFYQFDPLSPTAYEDEQHGEFLGLFVNQNIFKYALTIIFLTLAGIIFRATYLQIFKGQYYYGLADNNRSRVEYLIPTRGIIYDRNGQSLVSNQPDFYIAIVPANVPLREEERNARIDSVAKFLGMTFEEVKAILDKYPPFLKQPIVLKESVEYNRGITYAVNISNYPELELKATSLRNYNYGQSFAHTLGYVGKITKNELEENSDQDYLLNDVIGKQGVELSYEENLRGVYGRKEIEVDARGREKKVIYQKDPVRGDNLILTIDADLQDKIYQLTRNHLIKFGKKKASIIVEDPNDGSILAMVSYPTYDNNQFSGGISQENYTKLLENKDNPLFNRSIQGEYPSGSTIKMAVAAAALNENLINESTSFLSTGGIWVADKFFFPDWKAGGHGVTNVYKAMAESVNTFFYIIGGGYKDFNGLGVARLDKYFHQFGFGELSQIDLPNESNGLVPNEAWKAEVKKEQWYIGDTYHMAIGQGDVLVTPLQIANYTAVLANGGTLYQPHVVGATINDLNQKSVIPANVLKNDFLGDYDLSIVRKAMRRTVTDGSARYLESISVPVAGKTGTAQFAENKETHAWFTGFAPYEKPEIVVTVLIEEGGEGSAVAVPLAAKIMEYYFGEYKTKNIPSPEPAIDRVN